jgi:polyether ionophore transport system permease protein
MSTLTGTSKLVRLILRRDRLIMPVWIVFLALVLMSFPSSLREVFPTAAERRQYADNAGFVALYGRLSGTSLGEFVTWRAGFIPVLVGLISLLTVIRHTRVDEETGRRELLGSTVVGRHASLAAALSATFGANLVLAALVALGMISQDLPAAGSVALGLEFAAAGWLFAGVGAVAAQLTTSAAGARGIAVTVLGAAYVLRVGGDLSGRAGGAFSWLSWVSPIGLVHEIQPYGDERWWVLALAAGLTMVLAAAAIALSAVRDVGAGLVPTRSGPATAALSLRSPLALAWRLHRSLLAAWTAGFAALGVVFGGVAEGIGDMGQDNKNLQDIFTRIGGRGALIDSFLASAMALLGLIAAAYAVQATLKLQAEESSGRAEPVLATAVGRLQWAGSHLAFSVLGPTTALAAAGLTTGLTHGLNTGDLGGELPRVLGAAIVQLPAVWALAGLAVALFGLAPRLAPAAWGVLAVYLVLLTVGASLQLDHWLLDLSPFTHIPKAPGLDVSATPLVWLAAIAVVLTAAGLTGLQRRDIPAP